MIRLFLKNSLTYSIGSILTRGIGILLVPVYTNYLTPLEYGVIDLFIILASIVNLTIALEINQAVVRFYQDVENENDKIQYVSTAFFFTIFAYVIFLLISFVFSDAFTIWLLDDLKYQNVFLLAALAIFTSGIFYFSHGQLAWQVMPKHSSIVSVIHIVIVVGISVYLLVIEGVKIESIFIGQIIGNIVGIAISIYFTSNSYKAIFVYDKLQEMIRFSFPLVFSSLSIFIALFIDRLSIKYFLGLDELGVYGIAYRFAAVTGLVLVGFQSSLTPLIYKYYKEKETPRHISVLFELFMAFMIFVVVGSILFSKEVVILMSAKEFYSASSVIPLLVIAIFFTNMYIFMPGLEIEKKIKIIAIISIFGAILNASLNILLIPVYGINGAAFATLISAIITFIVRARMSQKYYLIQFKWGGCALGFFIAIISSYLLVNSFDGMGVFSISVKVLFLLILTLVIIVLKKEVLQKI